jgi:hypothetical protein
LVVSKLIDEPIDDDDDAGRIGRLPGSSSSPSAAVRQLYGMIGVPADWTDHGQSQAALMLGNKDHSFFMHSMK